MPTQDALVELHAGSVVRWRAKAVGEATAALAPIFDPLIGSKEVRSSWQGGASQHSFREGKADIQRPRQHRRRLLPLWPYTSWFKPLVNWVCRLLLTCPLSNSFWTNLSRQRGASKDGLS